MPQRRAGEKRLGEKVGDKLEEGLEQAMAGVKDLAAKAGVGSGDNTRSATRKKATRAGTGAVGRTRARAAGVTARTKQELYADAARLGIKGRSKMTKAELEKAVRRG
jgi:hypothetical protein